MTLTLDQYPQRDAHLPYHLSLPQKDQNIDRMFESLAAAGRLDEG